MYKYVRDIIIITIYSLVLLCQLAFSSYILYNKNNITNTLINYQNISYCKNDSIYRLQNGSLNKLSLLVFVSCIYIIITFLALLINKKLIKKDYESLNDHDFDHDLDNNDIIIPNLLNKYNYNSPLYLFFIIFIICFITCNGIQYVLQVNNISIDCIKYIDNYVHNFYIIYQCIQICSFISSYCLIITLLYCFIMYRFTI